MKMWAGSICLRNAGHSAQSVQHDRAEMTSPPLNGSSTYVRVWPKGGRHATHYPESLRDGVEVLDVGRAVSTNLVKLRVVPQSDSATC
jgi:hypothetical protein